uniref:NADH-ubiquinone oxidoreductase chain 2 n=1 Tax=Spathoderma clenchi TaxID=1638910 RepID=A0A343YNC8_9MOLL|nr:NADH dehydrogenase subunit 2 [Spathoderma clenchi]
MMGLGLLTALSTPYLFPVWLGLEINLMGMILSTCCRADQDENESAVKYFLVQAFGSTFILMAMLSGALWQTPGCLLFLAAMLIKLGAAPFHMWLPGVMASMTWYPAGLLATVQKLAPALLISAAFYSSAVVGPIILMNVAIGSIGGMNQTFTRPLMAYSALAHIAWLLAAATAALWSMALYLTAYLALNTIMFKLLAAKNIYNITAAKTNNGALSLTLMTLAGLPPSAGFVIKWAVLSSAAAGALLVPASLILGAMLTLYFYMLLTLHALVKTPPFGGLSAQALLAALASAAPAIALM